MSQSPTLIEAMVVSISTLAACELARLEELKESTKLRQPQTIEHYVPPFWSCFLDFIPIDRA